MNGHGLLRMAAAALLVVGAAGPSRAAEPAAARAGGPGRVTAVEVSPDGRLAIRGTAKPSFTVFKLAEPPRLVIDLAGADVTALASPVEVKLAGVRGVTTAQFDEGARRVGRLVVALEGDVRYDVVARDNDLLVAIGAPRADAAAPVVAPARPVETKVAAAVAAPPAAPADPNLVLMRDDEKAVQRPARTLSGVAVTAKAGAAHVRLTTDGEPAKFTVIELKDPARLALDLPGVQGKPQKVEGKGEVRSVRVARREGGVRVVVDGAEGRMPAYEVQRKSDGLEVRVGAPALAQAEPKPAPKPAAKAEAPAAPKAEPAAQPQLAEAARTLVAPSAIKAVDLRTDEGKTDVVILVDGPYEFEVTHAGATNAVLTLKGVTLPERLERKLDARELGGPVEMLTAYRVPGATHEVRVVASLRSPVKDLAQADKAGVRWTFDAPQRLAQAPAAAPARAAAAASEAKAGTAGGNVLDDRNYTGRRVDFNVKDIDIKNLLNAVADISKKNIIVADDVKGTVSIKLRNVPWDQALDIILKSKQLGKEEIGNIIRVAPLERLRAEAKEAADAAKIRQTYEPLKVRLVPVNYAVASGMVDKIKDSLSDRGTVTVDSRTNTLIIKDVQEALLRAEGIVRNLDTQTPEVLIESRIVEAASSFTRQIGVQWGGNIAFGPTTGNPTGLVFPSILQVAGAADDSTAPTTGLNGLAGQPNFAVNMPAPIGANAGGGLGFVFGSAGGAANLNLRLSAAENSGTIKTISSPRVVALDNVESTIGQGVSIPFSQVSAAGVNTTFIEAKLELKVTAHVTQEGSIQMKVAATNNQPNPQLTGSNGQPSISKREAKTEVLVKDGDTTVIGGIYTRRNSEAWNEVPFFSKIPIIGWLFKKKAVTDDRTELLIFITPRIVNRSQSTVASQSGDQQ